MLSVDPLLSPSLRLGLSLSVRSLPPLPGPSNLPLGLLDGDPPHAPPGHGVQVGIDVPLHGHAADAHVVGAWYVKPGGHGAHTEAPAVETVPHGHATQLAAPESGRRRWRERGKAAQHSHVRHTTGRLETVTEEERQKSDAPLIGEKKPGPHAWQSLVAAQPVGWVCLSQKVPAGEAMTTTMVTVNEETR